MDVSETKTVNKIESSLGTRLFFGIPLLIPAVALLWVQVYGFDSENFWTGIFFLLVSITLLFYPYLKRTIWNRFWSTNIGVKIYKPFRSESELTEEDKNLIEDRQKRVAIVFGKVFRPIFIIGIGIYCYSIIPEGIFDTSLAGLTLGDILSLVVGVGLSIGCISWLFRGSDEEKYEMWGNFSYIVISVLVLGGLYFYSK